MNEHQIKKIIIIHKLLARYVTKRFDHWEKLGVPHDKPHFPYGTHNLFDGRHLSDHIEEGYNKFR